MLFTHAATAGSGAWHTGWLPELLGGRGPLQELGGEGDGVGVGAGAGAGLGPGEGVGLGAGLGVGEGMGAGDGIGFGAGDGAGFCGGGCAPSPRSTLTVYAPEACASITTVPFKSVRYTVAPRSA
jgi:hypothetical protein